MKHGSGLEKKKKKKKKNIWKLCDSLTNVKLAALYKQVVTETILQQCNKGESFPVVNYKGHNH